jgi:hypothetical protein
VGRGVAGTTLLFFLLFFGCGDDLEFGTDKQGNTLRIGKGEHTLRFGAQSGGGKSGNRRIEGTTVHGNVFNLRPATIRPIVVFVFVDLHDPGVFQDFTDAEVAAVKDDRTFAVSNLAAGDLTIVFLLDQAAVSQDGTIDPGDPIATFQDSNGRLRNLSAAAAVTLEDLDIVFNLAAPDTGVATVRSEANIIVTQP